VVSAVCVYSSKDKLTGSDGKMRKVVVAGGAGFTCYHLAEALASNVYCAIIIDDLSSGQKDNIEELIWEALTAEVQRYTLSVLAKERLDESLDISRWQGNKA
jgi:UDP-glucose 4-epimerase